jgi:hypothetical protein
MEILGLGNLVVGIIASLIIMQVHVGMIPVTKGIAWLLLKSILACGFWMLVVLWKQVGVARGTTVGTKIAICGFIAITRLWLLIVIIFTAIDIRIGIWVIILLVIICFPLQIILIVIICIVIL